MDTVQPGHQFRASLLDAPARSHGLDRKRHLYVSSGELIPSKPFMLAQLALHEVSILVDLHSTQDMSWEETFSSNRDGPALSGPDFASNAC